MSKNTLKYEKGFKISLYLAKWRRYSLKIKVFHESKAELCMQQDWKKLLSIKGENGIISLLRFLTAKIYIPQTVHK